MKHFTKTSVYRAHLNPQDSKLEMLFIIYNIYVYTCIVCMYNIYRHIIYGDIPSA